MTDNALLPADDAADGPTDNVTDWCQQVFHQHYGDTSITKDDIWFYLYGVMHAKDWRETYKHDLQRSLPKVPLAADFQAFRSAGERLMEIHADYELQPEQEGVVCLVDDKPSEGEADAAAYRIAKKMKYGKVDGKARTEDRSVIVINGRCKIVGIPLEAHEYEVSGRSPLKWFMETCRRKIDKNSGIEEDPNGWHEWEADQDAFNLVRRIRQLAWISCETTQVVNSLPPSLTGDHFVDAVDVGVATETMNS